MNDLIMKEVEFQGNKIIAICEDGKIYVVIKRICENLGMDKSQSDYQIQKIQKDGLLEGACRNKHLKTNGGIQESLIMELDYLPAWLFKINPARFDEELKEKLMFYQLKEKDVLADAFFGKRKDEIPLLPEDKDWGLKRIHDRADQAKEIEKELYPVIKFLESIYEEIEGIAKIKKDSIFREFKNFKTDEKYDASKEKLPSLELEKNDDGSIEIKVK